MVANGQVSVPTLAMMEAVVRDLAPPGDSYDFSRDSVAKLHAAGVPILAGTDALSHSFLSVPVMPGASLHHELALLVGADTRDRRTRDRHLRDRHPSHPSR